MVAWLSDDKVKEVRNLAQEVCQREDCRLYDMEWGGGGKNKLLRIFAIGQEKPIHIDQCTEISRGLSFLLDTKEIIPAGSYHLEVSSPGLERKLREPWHFKRAIHKWVQFTLLQPLDISVGKKVRHIQARIVEIRHDRVLVETDKIGWEIFFHDIKRAQVVFDFKKISQYVYKER